VSKSEPSEEKLSATTPAAPVLEIRRAGLCTTIQDLGRPGLGRLGVGPSGAMDAWAHRVANQLLGNDPSAVALELTGAGVEVQFLQDTRFALAGGDLGATLDGAPVPALCVFPAVAGALLSFLERRQGARVTLAVAGGLRIAPALGSAATDLGAGIGGIGGRPLRSGQQLQALPVKRAPLPPELPTLQRLRALLPLPAASAPVKLRFVPEPEGGTTAQAQSLFATRSFKVSQRSGRTGYRLEGTPLPTRPDPERLSEPTAPNAIQLPPDGLPILLMADRNTTGGYPRLGHLCTVDRSLAAQLWPGDEVRFTPITVDEAVALARQAERDLRSGLAKLAR
jgi:biotin-dependent carboxylase-like uncharacterized protein